MPDQLAELLHAQYAAASLSMAMFHHHRTGEGQQVGVDLFRTSWWSVAGVLPYLMGDPSYDRARLGFAGVVPTSRESGGARVGAGLQCRAARRNPHHPRSARPVSPSRPSAP